MKTNNQIQKEQAYSQSRYSATTKTIIAIISGVLCLVTSKFGINALVGDTNITISYSILFPIIIAMSFGWRYGLIASLSGPIFIPSVLWAEDGFANLVTALIYTFYFTAIGTLNALDVKMGQKPVFKQFGLVFLIFSVLVVVYFNFLFNPLLSLNQYFWSPNVITHIHPHLLIFFTIKDIISFATFTIIADVLLRISEVRVLLGIGNQPELRNNLKIFVVAVTSSMLIWLCFAGLSIALIPNVELHDGHFALGFYVIVASALIASRAIIYYTEKQLLSESQFRSLFENAADAIFIADSMTGIIIDANNEATQLLKMTRHEIIGRHQATLHPAEKEDYSKETFSKQKTELEELNTSLPVEHVVVCSDGSLIPIEVLASKVIYKGRECQMGTFRNISKRKESENALRESEERFKALHNASFGGIAIHDKGVILECNQGLVEMTGFSYEELIGMNGLLLIAECDRELVLNNIKSGFEEPYEAMGVRKNGEEFPMRLEARNIPYKGKQVRTVEFRDITDAKKAERAIAHSHQLMQYIIEHSQTGVAVHDRNFKYVYVSQQYLNDFGLKYDDIIGKHHYEVFPDLPQKWREVHQKALMGEISSSDADSYVREDGKTDWTKWECRPWHDLDGEIGGFIVYTEMITDRKISEIKLRESEERNKAIVSALPDILMRINNKMEIIDCVAPDESQLFMPKEMFIGKELSEILPPNVAKITIEKIQLTLKHINLQVYDYQLSVGGKLHWFEARMVPSGINEVLVIIRTITQQKELETELKVLSNAIEQNPASIVITSPDGAIEYVNPKFSELTGYTAQEAKGQNPSILKSGQTPDSEYATLWKTITNGQTWRGELCNRKKDGSLYWESVNISPVFDLNGKINHFVAVKEDITHKKEMDRKLLAAIIEGEEKERNRFAQELHDGLGPILSSIKLYFQWLAEIESSDKRDLVVQKGNHNIEEALLTLREISNNLSPRTLNTFGLVSPIRNFIEGINQLNQVHINFETNIDIRFDKNIEISMYRIIMELINNSLKHSGASLITINLNVQTFLNQITLIYTDNGKGFSIEHNLKKMNSKGLLNIQNRVSSINGTIVIESIEGMGIQVKIEVPVTLNS